MNAFADILSLIVLVLFGLSLGETGWIVRVYFKIAANTRALLPVHVVMVGLATLMLELEVITVFVANRFGTPLTWVEPFNLVAFGLLWISLITIRQHVTQKHRGQVLSKIQLRRRDDGRTT